MSLLPLNPPPHHHHHHHPTNNNNSPAAHLSLLQTLFTHRDLFATGQIDTNPLPRLHIPSHHLNLPRSINGPRERYLTSFIDAHAAELHTGPPGPVGVVFLVDPHGREEVFFFLRDERDRRAINPEGREWYDALCGEGSESGGGDGSPGMADRFGE
ncbi:MAG: hypothetical protein M1835_006437 [Candelina submexicana]|nr:MAG: hypothetical protein M1835_006437 [Candelina submexicana]